MPNFDRTVDNRWRPDLVSSQRRVREEEFEDALPDELEPRVIYSRELSFVPARRRVFEPHDAQTVALIRQLAELERLPHGERVGASKHDVRLRAGVMRYIRTYVRMYSKVRSRCARNLVRQESLYSERIDPLTSPSASLTELVEAVRDLAYGRPSDRTVRGMLRERCGTCSTKHLFLAQSLVERFPDTEPRIVHRVYHLDHTLASELFGAEVADAVPSSGLTDVHRFLTVALAGRRIELDATFAGAPWDGRSALPPACGPGTDYPAGTDPDADKRALESAHCEPLIREPFIAALSSVYNASPGRHTSSAVRS